MNDKLAKLLDEFRHAITDISIDGTTIFLDFGHGGPEYEMDNEMHELQGITILPENKIRRDGKEEFIVLGQFYNLTTNKPDYQLLSDNTMGVVTQYAIDAIRDWVYLFTHASAKETYDVNN